MTPGTILFDGNFEFKDGDSGEKLFIALNDGANGVYVCVKTTSKGHRYSMTSGCQALDRFPNFFVPKHGCCLKENTWIQLDAFYEFERANLIQKVMTGEIVRVGTLDEPMTKDLIVCATHSEDLTKFQEKELTRQLAALTAKKMET